MEPLDREESCAPAERLFRTVISWEPLMPVRAAKRRKRIAEVPVSAPLQIVRWGAACCFQVWHEVWKWT